MFKIDDKEVKRLEARLGRLHATGLAYATRKTLNDTAFEARKQAQQGIRDGFILRNKFTESSIRVTQARGGDISTQQARMGSVAPYMATQENGGTKSPASGRAVTIPTSYSAGQTGVRTRLPRGANKMRAIQLRAQRVRATSQAQRNLLAYKSGEKFIYMDLGRRRGIFRVVRGGVRMVHDLSRSSVHIKSRPWMKPAVALAMRSQGDFYRRALEFQLNRLG